MFIDLFIKCLAVNPQDFRGLGLVAPHFREHPDNVLFFHVLQGLGFARQLAVFMSEVGRQIGCLDGLGFGHEGGSTDYGLQFPDIAGPGIV